MTWAYAIPSPTLRGYVRGFSQTIEGFVAHTTQTFSLLLDHASSLSGVISQMRFACIQH
ncbi:MAG: hypothetical protein ACRDAM_16515 [Casimicrobium sp.]